MMVENSYELEMSKKCRVLSSLRAAQLSGFVFAP